MNKTELAKFLRAVAKKIDDDPGFVEELLCDAPPRKREPLLSPHEWEVGDLTKAWIEDRWPGVDYAKPLEDFRTYWAEQGKKMTAKRWNSYLRRNPVFIAQMDKAPRVDLKGTSPLARMTLDTTYHPPISDPWVQQLLRDGSVVAIDGLAYLPWQAW